MVAKVMAMLFVFPEAAILYVLPLVSNSTICGVYRELIGNTPMLVL